MLFFLGKNLKYKKDEMFALSLAKAGISESLSPEFLRLDYLRRRLKKDGLLYESWFFKGHLFVKDLEASERFSVNHITELYARYVDREITITI